jgi:predicted enzyme related to lactoylglutathione lyase
VPKRNTTTPGAPCWIDLSTSDPDKSRAFYGDLFGWTSEDAGEDYGHYINFSRNGSRVAGCMQNDPEWNTPDGWSVYLLSADAKETADAAAQHGGQVIIPATDVRELGTMAVVTDVGGASIGVWKPGLHEGFEIVAEPGTPGWFELHTRDYDKAVQFYRDVFHWDARAVSDSSDFRYTTLGEGDTAQAGIMDASNFLPDGVPAHWSVYFQVEDTDAALQRTGELGGSTVAPAEDTPYGRLATASDPTGAIFKLMANT